MKCKIFFGQPGNVEKEINEWLTPNLEVAHTSQSALTAVAGDKPAAYVLISIFYRTRGAPEPRELE